jgi:hypothetical protein
MTSPVLACEWNPGLDNADRTLEEVLRTMPKDPPESVPWYVKLLENPASPVALAGAVSLFAHDCIHVLLGRGLHSQDEAFVIGFTMGASGRLTPWQEVVFRWCTKHLYRGVYRFSPQDQAVFDLAVSAGRWAGAVPLHEVDFQPRLAQPLGVLRRELRIPIHTLYQLYETERVIWPGSPASLRLPRGPSLQPPRGGLQRPPHDAGNAPSTAG